MKKLLIFYITIFSTMAFSQGDIYLSIPTDGELIEDNSLNFIWQASSLGSQEDPRLSQELVVSEMKTDQTPFEAIEINSPILNKSNIMGASHFVSQSNFPFEEGKKYAWQIRYYMNGVVISRSEAWWFEMAKPDVQPREFVPIRLKSDGRVMTAEDDQLYLSLITKKQITLNAIIIDETGVRTAVALKEILGFEEVEGEITAVSNESRNFILDLQDLELNKGTYTLRWRINKESDYTMLFKIG